MRVRMFGLRLLAAVLTALWTIAAIAVLLGYRPGGPIDGVVGLVACLPVGISLLGLFWPPVARGDRAFAAMAWLGLGAALLLIPSIAGVLGQLLGRGPQTLLPSLEAAYPWLLALAATSLFGGLGVARRLLGVASLRGRRIGLGMLIAAIATALGGSLFAAAAIANDDALRGIAGHNSRFGPTVGDQDPPACDATIAQPNTAILGMTLRGDVDGRPIGTVDLHGARNGQSVSWTADVATQAAFGQYGLVRNADATWVRRPGSGWTILDDPSYLSPSSGLPSPATHPGLDLELLGTALAMPYRTAAETRGLEFVEGARALHCRVALDGRTFQAAFPEVVWLASRQDLHRWRGALDYWIFLDGAVGQVEATVNGEAQSLGFEGLQAYLHATLTATDRGSPVTVEGPPT